MDQVLFSLGDLPVTAEMALLTVSVVFAALLVAVLVVSIRGSRQRAEEARRQAAETEAARKKTEEAERTLAHLLQVQNEMTGRMQTMAEIFGSRTSDLARLVMRIVDERSRKVLYEAQLSSQLQDPNLSQEAFDKALAKLLEDFPAHRP